MQVNTCKRREGDNVFLAKSASKHYTVMLLYFAIAAFIYNAWCVFNAHRQKGGHMIALEAKLSICWRS